MPDKKRVAILGAGPAGLGAGYYLASKGYAVSIIDRAHYVGGASASFKIKDYIVDYGPHAFHTKKPEIIKIANDLLGNEYVEVKRNQRLILDGKNLQYPLNIKEALSRISPVLSLNIIADYFLTKIKSICRNDNRHFKTFEEWGIDAFGNILYSLAFGDYSEKMWGLSGRQLSVKLAQQKLLKLNLWKLILNLIGIIDTTYEGGVTEYYDMYPRFGIGTMFDKMAGMILKDARNQIYLNSQITKISNHNGLAKRVEFLHSGEKKTVEFDYLVSAIPLKYFVEYLLEPKEKRLIELAKQLKYRDIRIIYVVMDKDYYSNIHWIYLLDKHFRFNRLSEQKNLNKESSPSGKTVISLDISCNYNDSVWNMTDEELFKLALHDLNYMGIKKSHICDYFTLKVKDVYPIYDLGFEKKFDELIDTLSKYPNVYSTGRQGLFLNNDMHDSIKIGMATGDFISREEKSNQWYDYITKYIKEVQEGNIK